MDLAESFITIKNPLGLLTVSTQENQCTIAFPDEKVGFVKVVNFSKEKTVQCFKAHNSDIAAFKLSQDGNVIVTASNKGTLLRMFNAHTGEQINEVRRGAD